MDQTFALPGGKVQRRIDDLICRLALQAGDVVRAAGHTEATADAVRPIDYRNVILFADGTHLAAIDAGQAALALIRVDDSVVVGAGDRLLNAPLGNAAQDGATATAAAVSVLPRKTPL